MSTLTSEEASGTPTLSCIPSRITHIYLFLNLHLEYFQQIHGRAFPLAQNSPLFLPTDNVEVQRLDLQHTMLKGVLNGNYYGPVKGVLSETGERRKRVLDLPTAEGNWVREMAAEFPHVDFTSVDTVPLVPHAQSRNILGYEVYDLHSGIAEADGSFDLVHVKQVSPKIWDLAALVLEIYRVLRPGGLLIWTEFD
ncbi:S-adenosyl-L-methionine-dependent methyltransferase, partial [Ceratobasidium sp. AG-I]